MVSFPWFAWKRALIILSFTGAYSNIVFLTFLFITIATPPWCFSSFLPEYSIVSTVFVIHLPHPVHLHSLIPIRWSLYALISLMTWACFLASYIVLTFQHPIVSFVLVFRILFMSASAWLSLTAFMLSDDCWYSDLPIYFRHIILVNLNVRGTGRTST